MEAPAPNSAPSAPLCTAIAVGDVCVWFSLWIVVIIFLLMILGPLFYRFVWRPRRIRYFLDLERLVRREHLVTMNASQKRIEEEERKPVYLSGSLHDHLGMDEETSIYSYRAAKRRLSFAKPEKDK